MTITAVAGQEGQAGNIIGAASQAFTFAGNVTAGNLIVVGANRYNVSTLTAFASGDLTKTAGTATIDSPVLHQHKELNDGSEYQQGIWSALVTGTGSLTVTVGGGVSGAFWNVEAGEYPSDVGWDAGRAEAGNLNSTTSNGTSPATSGNASSAGAALFWGMLGADGSGVISITPDAAFTQVGEQESASTHLIGAAERQIVSGGTTDQAEWTIGAGNTFWSALLQVFKEASGGGATTRGSPFDIGNAFGGGRTFAGPMRRIFLPPRKLVIAHKLPKAA